MVVVAQQDPLWCQFPPFVHHANGRIPAPDAAGYFLVLAKGEQGFVGDKMIIERAGGVVSGVGALGEGERPEHPPLAQEVAPMYIIAVRIGGFDEIGDDVFRCGCCGRQVLPPFSSIRAERDRRAQMRIKTYIGFSYAFFPSRPL